MNTLLKTNLGKVIHVHRVNGGTDPHACPGGVLWVPPSWISFCIYPCFWTTDIVRLLFLHVPFAYFCGFSQ